jgi:hypothetical protein
MNHLLFVGDGPRDEAMLPPMVSNILDVELPPHAEFLPWNMRFHDRPGKPKGYGRKLEYAVRRAISHRKNGLVAVADRDKAAGRERLKELQRAREQERAKGTELPIALGEAVPHPDAWLLDDPVAVRQGLSLPADCAIPTVRKVASPKDTLNAPIAKNPDSDDTMTSLSDIARHWRLDRCCHQKETGLAAFFEDVHRELGPLKTTRVPQ